ncbi:MAG: mycofactocin-coupled SDR family oxidoreductase [Acidimicrobiales bacterium]|nr:mycofactocin-coupled SDR family oxidoreductase [Acidimicrobiales bacterium]
MAGSVALITGVARGQGRSHAVRLAREGADIIGIDLCADVDAIPYPLATPADLDETARLVAETGARVITARVDVRDLDAMVSAVEAGVAELGRLDVVVANAGVCTVQRWDEVTPAVWDAVIGTNLTGAWHTCVASIPHLLDTGAGSIILISSTAGLKGQPFFAPYAASKHGMVGVMRVLANELAASGIRVNSIHPTGVDTPMLAGLDGLTKRIDASPDTGSIFLNSLPVDLVAPEDVSEALVYLASTESRYVTGLTLTVDAGASAR